MNKEEIKELQEKTYAISWSGFPLDAFFNDIRDNPNSNFDKDSAYQDLKKIVDKFYKLIDKANKYDELTKTPTLEEVKKEWEELGYEWVNIDLHLMRLISEDLDTIIIINNKTKCYAVSEYSHMEYQFITDKEHQLLTKTFRALGWFDAN